MTIDSLTRRINSLERKTFAHGELIKPEDDCYWLMQQGIVQTCTWTESGNPITFGYWSTYDLIGNPYPPCCPYYIKCLTHVEARRISFEQTSEFIDLIQRQIRQTEEILFILRADTFYQRLQLALIWLGNKFGREIDVGNVIQLKLSHLDLAELVGATRVTVTKLINQLEQEGFLLRPRRNTIVLLNQSEPSALGN